MAETGLILKGVGGFYTVLNDRGEEVVCRARGRFRKVRPRPMAKARHYVRLMLREMERARQCLMPCRRKK